MDVVASTFSAVDWRELVWFCSITAGLHASVLTLLCSAIEIVEKYGLFQESKIQKKPAKFHQPSNRAVVKHVMLLHVLLQPLGLPAFYLLLSWRGVQFSGPTPPWQEIVIQIALFLLIEDTMFYWLHRLMHTQYLYKTLHKLHHRYHQPVPLSVEYFHPLEFFLANSVPIFLGPILLRCHVVTFWVWLVLRIWEGVDGHCGYDFWFVPFRYFPFRPGANVHDYHHSHNVGNYGSFFVFWDKICGTDMSYADYQARMEKGGTGKMEFRQITRTKPVL